MSMTKFSDDERRDLRRDLFKNGVVSALFSLFQSRKKQAAAEGSRFLLQDMAAAVGVDKSQASRWFSGDLSPNWRLGTLFDLADALDGEVRLQIIDRKTKEVHTPQGIEAPHIEETSAPSPPHKLVYFVDMSMPEFVERHEPKLWTATAPRDPVYSYRGDVLATAAA